MYFIAIALFVVYLILHNRAMLIVHRGVIRLRQAQYFTKRENTYFTMMLIFGWGFINATILTLMVLFIIVGK